MRRARWIPLPVLLLVLFACSRPEERAYYTLRYPAPVAKFETPHPVTIRVKDLEVRESYDRSELAQRADLVELHYHSARRWSESPHKMITDVLRDHLTRSGLVAQVVAEIGQQPPEYTLTGEVVAIEQIATPEGFAARLAMSLRLVRFSDDTIVWRFQFDDRRPAGDGLPRTTVRTQREILASRFDEALVDLDRHLKGEPPPAPVEAVASGPLTDRVLPDPASPLNALPQVANDPTPIAIGRGALMVPAYTTGDQEPSVTVFKDGTVVAEGQSGTRVVLPPGDYDVRLGTGTFAQQVRVPFRIEEGRTTVIPRTWAGLVIDVVDAQFVPFRGAYELIRMDDREEFGIGFGADRLQGEKLRAWVLPPGLYKIIRSGGTYRDRTDFATVRLSAGELSRFTLVVDPDTDEFLGAGEADPEDVARAEKSAWAVAGVLGGAPSFSRDKQENWNLKATLFFDGSLSYQSDPHQWVTRFDIEEQLSRPEDGDFVNEKDRFFFHSIYTYHLIPWFGPYARAGVETSFFDRYEDFDPRQVVCEPGETAPDCGGEMNRIRLASTFAPLKLTEGAGGNFRILRSRNIELDLRLGFGARQNFANGLLIFNDLDNSSGSLDTVVPAGDATPYGGEGTLVGVARLSRWVTLTTEFDGLMPINDEKASFTWRNQASLRLIRFMSINYRFNANRDVKLERTESILTEHDVQLRFSYTLF